MELSALGRGLIVFGIALVVLGAILTFAGKIPHLGRLPGDIVIRRGQFSFYFPVVTCLILSVVLTLIARLIGRR